ncbi:hypothetical protein Ancab_024612 [Ancistrocladus abbreviatus]
MSRRQSPCLRGLGLMMSKNQALEIFSRKKVGTSWQEWTYKSMNQDKTSGNYQQVTAGKFFFSGDIVIGGQPAHESEYKVTKTVRTGSDGGYVEYHKEERITKVDYNKSSNFEFLGYNLETSNKGYKGYGGSKKYYYWFSFGSLLWLYWFLG